MPDYRYVGTHADQLASGRQIAPGDQVKAADVNDDDPLLESGLLIEIPPKGRKKETSE